MLSYFGLLILGLIVMYMLFVHYHPSFGGDVTEKRQQLYVNSHQYENGTFHNQDRRAPKDFSFSEILKISRKFFFEKVENGIPKTEIPIQRIDSTAISNFDQGAQLFWFGHAAFLLQIDGKNILLDPMLSDVPAPHPWLGSKRFSKQLPIEIEKLPNIDAVVISHDHYDHLDYTSITKLKDKVDAYFVPLGIGVHLESWGVSHSKIHEMDWWEKTTFKNIELVCTPAQHYSGRKFSNRKSTLWSSWIIKSSNTNVFFSGDSGYGEHFKQIGERHGPFDFAMIECGQYNTMWPEVHMFPEETAQAGVDVKAKIIMPIHWGAFKLAMHAWTEPIERVRKKAQELDIRLVAPKIGAPIVIEKLPEPHAIWW